MFTDHGRQIVHIRDGINGNESARASGGLGVFDTTSWDPSRAHLPRALSQGVIREANSGKGSKTQILAAAACVEYLRGIFLKVQITGAC